MADETFEWSGRIGEVTLGATSADGGTRSRSYRLGGETDLPFLDMECSDGTIPLVAFELCDDPAFWSPIIAAYVGDRINDTPGWAKEAETRYGADLIRLYLTSTKTRGFNDFASIGSRISDVLSYTTLPLIIEGSNDPSIDSEVFQHCGEAGAGERLLLGTAEAGRYRSVAAAAMAYNHSVIAQSPIDINLAKQLNILLREIGVPSDRVMIDPYTGTLGYGFEYSYSVMERIRYAALKGDTDLAMPMISSAADSLTVKEVREANPGVRDEIAVKWEFYAALSAAIAGAAIVCVRHPATVPMLKEAFKALRAGKPIQGGT
ncbi:MAG TPA: acetyl-CoA decarbonylase/synthase complex subunit delta [Methanoregulaceae archaeon]|nr:acetyl-CoA decarbonylase/synthase complex subunit delta [Methanoregulaceae archaeon]